MTYRSMRIRKMSESEREEFRKIVEALKNNRPDDEIRDLVEKTSCNPETDVDEDGHTIVFYFEEYCREELWERMYADWEAEMYAAAMEDYDLALKPSSY